MRGAAQRPQPGDGRKIRRQPATQDFESQEENFKPAFINSRCRAVCDRIKVTSL